MPPKAVLFDIGNVLVSFNFALTFPVLEHRTPRTFPQIRAHLSGMTAELETGRLTTEDFITRALDFIGGDVTRAEFIHAFTGIFALIEPVWEIVASVRLRAPVYLFSNTSELHETYLRREFPGFAQFDGGFFSWRLGTMKPEPGMYEAALERLGLRGGEIAYVDDLPDNIAAGRRQGFHSHQYDRTQHDALTGFLRSLELL